MARTAEQLTRRAFDKIYKFVMALLLPLKLNLRLLRKPISKKHSLQKTIIITLTSYPARFNELHLTLKSLLLQSITADQIILWISHNDQSLLPRSVKELTKYGLKINFCEDLKSYKKIIPSLNLYKESYLVTADDDVYYHPTWLVELIEESKQYPLDVICHRAHTIKLDKNSTPLPYSAWDIDSRHYKSSTLTFQTGVGGVLYPPNVFFKDVTNVDLINQLCSDADDIWLYWMARLNKRSIKLVKGKFRNITWFGSQNIALWRSNLSLNNNDVKVTKMLNHYGKEIFLI